MQRYDDCLASEHFLMHPRILSSSNIITLAQSLNPKTPTHVHAGDVALVQVVDGALHLFRQLVRLDGRPVWALPLLMPRAAARRAWLVLELLRAVSFDGSET